MDYFSALPRLMNKLEQFIPDDQREEVANKASEYLNESLCLSARFNQLALVCDRDSADFEDLANALTYINLALTELSHISNAIKIDNESKAATTSAAMSKAKGGAK